tara:strand:- start:259 stop:1011 length:753 start_codon:yes stop_codon:yes gene_type:complete
LKNNSSVALIPARSGSKRISNKNIRNFSGHPLIAYTITSAINSKIFSDVIISTDSELYSDIGTYYGGSVYSMRPSEISGDFSPDIEWVKYVLTEQKRLNKTFKYFSILRPTSPFRSSKIISKAMDLFKKNKEADSIRAVELCAQHPAKMWTYKNKFIQPILEGSNGGTPWHSSQYASLPKIYVQNASLEIAKTSVVFDDNSISGKNIIPFFSKDYEGLDINNEQDWIYAEFLLDKNKVKLPSIEKKPYRV